MKQEFTNGELVTWDSNRHGYKWAIPAVFIKYAGKKSAQIKCGEKVRTVRLTSLRKK